MALCIRTFFTFSSLSLQLNSTNSQYLNYFKSENIFVIPAHDMVLASCVLA